MASYPLKFEPFFIEKVWGGTKIKEHFGKQPRESTALPIGESWELADLPGFESIITNGPHAGQTLRQVLESVGHSILGDLALTPQGRFPLLLKFLAARTALSVQVHPPAGYLGEQARHEIPKHEAWYIIDAEPDAVIYRGIQAGVTPAQFQQHLRAGTVPNALIKIPARPGRCYFVPAGTVHAIGAGVFLAEIQLPSNLSYRLFDWGRTEREMHCAKGLACLDYNPPDVREIEQRSHIAGTFTTISKLCDSPYFRIERVRMSEGYGQEIPYRRPAAWMVLQGHGLISQTPAGIDVEIKAGDVLLMPAGMPEARIDFNADTVWLEIQFPTTLENERLA